MRFNRRSLRFTLRPVHFPLYWQWVLIIFKPPLFTFSPFTWCLICTFLYHISHDCGSISHTKPKTMDDPTSLVSLDNSCGAGWLSAHSSYYSPRSRGRRGTVEMADLTDYFRFDWLFSGADLETPGPASLDSLKLTPLALTPSFTSCLENLIPVVLRVTAID